MQYQLENIDVARCNRTNTQLCLEAKRKIKLSIYPLAYSDYSCEEVKSEMYRVQSKGASLDGQIEDNAVMTI